GPDQQADRLPTSRFGSDRAGARLGHFAEARRRKPHPGRHRRRKDRIRPVVARRAGGGVIAFLIPPLKGEGGRRSRPGGVVSNRPPPDASRSLASALPRKRGRDKKITPPRQHASRAIAPEARAARPVCSACSGAEYLARGLARVPPASGRR